MLYARYFHDVTGVSPIDGGRVDRKGGAKVDIVGHRQGISNNIGQLLQGLDEASTIAGAQRTGVAD